MTPPHDYDLETLMAYVRGGLDTATADAIEAAAARDPKLAADLAVVRGVRSAEADRADDAAATEFGWARLSKAIDASTPPVSRGQQWRETRLGLLQVAACAVAAIAIWQALAVPLLAPTSDGSDVYVPATEAPAEQHALKVMFRDAVTEAELRTLLLSVDADVTGGPSAIGLYTLSFESEEARDEAESVLKAATEIVDVVQRD